MRLRHIIFRLCVFTHQANDEQDIVFCPSLREFDM